MALLSPEFEKYKAPRLGDFPPDYQTAMAHLRWIANQIAYTREPNEVLSHLAALCNVLELVDPESSFEDRMCPLTDQDVEELGLYGSFRLLGSETHLQPIAIGKYVHRSDPQTVLNQLFQDGHSLDIYDLCPEGDLGMSEMKLIAIRDKTPDEGNSDAPWNIGWVTQSEFSCIFAESSDEDF